MVDPAPQSCEGPSVAETAETSWQDQARSGNWKKALALAQLQAADPHVVEALERIVGVQSHIRARRYLQAKDSLRKLQQSLAEFPQSLEGCRQSFEQWVRPDALQKNLELLEQEQANTDPVTLRAQLMPVCEHPLTKAEALNMMGVLHARRRESEAAQHCLEQALAHDAGHYRARMNIGNIALEAGQLSEAEQAFRQVLSEAPEYDGAHHNLGVVLRRQGKLYESVRAIRKSQRLGVRRIREDTSLEAKQQLAVNPKLRLARFMFFGLIAGVFLWLMFGIGR